MGLDLLARGRVVQHGSLRNWLWLPEVVFELTQSNHDRSLDIKLCEVDIVLISEYLICYGEVDKYRLFSQSESLICPQRTTSSPNGYHLTFFNLAAEIAFPPSSKRLAGETTTPPSPSHVGAIVTITLSSKDI